MARVKPLGQTSIFDVSKNRRAPQPDKPKPQSKPVDAGSALPEVKARMSQVLMDVKAIEAAVNILIKNEEATLTAKQADALDHIRAATGRITPALSFIERNVTGVSETEEI